MANWKEYTTKTTPEDADEIMIADSKANVSKRTPFSGLWNWIAGKLATAVISQLETQNKSIIPALNELNSKPRFKSFSTNDKGATIVLTPASNVPTYHFSAFCYGEKNGEYAFAIICYISQKAEGCSVIKSGNTYEIRMTEWSSLNIISPFRFSCSIK